MLYSYFNLGARWGGWLTPRPGRFTPGKETRYPIYRLLGGPQDRSGRVRKEWMGLCENKSVEVNANERSRQETGGNYTSSSLPLCSICKWSCVTFALLGRAFRDLHLSADNYSGDEVWTNEMDRTCGMCGGEEWYIRVVVGRPEGYRLL